MSLIVEIAGMVGGMLAEYASSKQWSKLKTFFVSSGCFFSLFTIYVLLFPSDKGLYIGVSIAIGLALTLGACVIGLMYYHEKHKA
jgi:Na+-transporting NADH:ubiquinone oxidoreductase subunit NqrB